MADPSALQEAVQRARQLAAKITQSAPTRRPPTSGPSDHSGPVRVTLAYEKPASNNNIVDNHSPARQERRRSPSRDYNRNERESRDYQSSSSSEHRDNNNHNQRDSNSSLNRSNISSGYNSQSQQESGLLSSQQQTLLPSHQPPQQPAAVAAQPPQSTAQAPRFGEEKIELIIPHAVIGLVIGKGGENIKRIQNESGATVRVDPNTIDEKGNKLCTITGSKQAVDEAHAQVANVIENAAQNKRPRMQNDQSSDSYRMRIPAHRTGAIIGKGGETIKAIKQQSGCEIELDKNAKECGQDESVFVLRGSQDKIQKARSLIEQRLARGARDGPNGAGGDIGGGSGVGGGAGRGRDHHHHQGGGGGSSGGDYQNRSSRGVATGANAAPIAQYTDLPTPYSAQADQQQAGSADMTAAWAAYMAQYSSMFSQPGAQANVQAAAGMQYGAAGQPNLMGATAAAVPTATSAAPTMMPQMAANPVPTATSQLPVQSMPASGDPSQQAPNSGANQSQDYTDQWIEFYLANGRPDYAEQMIQMKKQQQQHQAQNPQSQ